MFSVSSCKVCDIRARFCRMAAISLSTLALEWGVSSREKTDLAGFNSGCWTETGPSCCNRLANCGSGPSGVPGGQSAVP